MDGALEQLLDLSGGISMNSLGEREDLPHAHADELVAFAVRPLPVLKYRRYFSLLRRTVRFKLFDKSRCAVGVVDVAAQFPLGPSTAPTPALFMGFETSRARSVDVGVLGEPAVLRRPLP